MRPAFLTALLALATLAPLAAAQPAAEPPPQAGVLMPPRLVAEPDVAYPEGASGAATVTLVVVVNADGSVRSATPAEPNEPFSRAAARAAAAWRFEPATRDGKAVAARIRLEVVFHASATSTSTPASTSTPTPTPASTPTSPDEVLIRGAHVEPSRTATLDRNEVRQIPGTFGDPFRALEIMPGVTPIISGLPFFFVRGAPPGDVGYFLDGIRVPYLYHVFIGPSVIHPAMVDRVDLYPGGYPSRFGRFSGGIVSGETVSPADMLHGEYNVRLFDAGALVETPFDDGRGVALVGGRYSYTGLLISLASPNNTLDYWDYQTRVSYDMTRDDRIGVFAFGAYDNLGQKNPDGTTTTVFGTQFHRVDLRYDRRLSETANMRTAVTLGEDLTDLGDTRFLRDRIVAARTEVTERISPTALVRAGIDAQADAYDVVLQTATIPQAEQGVANLFPSRADLSTGIRGDVVLDLTKRFQVTPGMRVDMYGSEGATAFGLDPRLATRTAITNRVHLLTAVGIAHQTPAFVLPLPGFQPGGLQGGLQTALQESTGVEFDLGQQTTATATLYHNAFFDMSDALSVQQPAPSGCSPGSFPTDTLPGDTGAEPGNGSRNCGQRFKPGTLGPDRTGGGPGGDNAGRAQTLSTRSDGSAYGLEIFVKRKLTSRIGGLLSYTLSRSTRVANGQEFIAAFDRTHVFNAAVAYDLGRNWRAGTRVTFYTGLPKAPDPTNPSTRLDPFFRLDLRLEKRWPFAQRRWISFVAEWMNATLSKEAFGTVCTLNGCQETMIGPITIPSIGIEGGF